MTDWAHEVLGTAPDDAPVRLKAAFRRFARAHHPDLGGDLATFRRGLEAYRKLTGAENSPAPNVVFYRRARGLAIPLEWWRRRHRPPRVH